MTEAKRRLRALLVIEQCNPEWPSVPLVGYRLYQHISELVDVTLVTHVRNEQALRARHPQADIIILRESRLGAMWHSLATRLSTIRGKTIWPLYHTLTYPTYAEFDRKVLNAVGDRIRQREFDVVHAITPMMPRYPYSVHKVCGDTPFVIGPVNGGVPYPKGFSKVARSEYSFLNVLRSVGRYMLSGYRQTYENADLVFSGSTYTKRLLESLFSIKNEIILLSENGLEESFFPKTNACDGGGSGKPIEILFVGRLVPYKGADIAIDALAGLPSSVRSKVRLTIVGEGSERAALEARVVQLGLGQVIRFIGWVPQGETINYYRSADIFCFPSVREFGGAVVLEAMANNLPCIVVNNGGVAEYITEKEGFKIEPMSREHLTSEIAHAIRRLVEMPQLRQQMGLAAGRRARDYTWTGKAQRIVDAYHELGLARRGNCCGRTE
jgi:glycosyltransferase involved in cell wall biosynthesis